MSTSFLAWSACCVLPFWQGRLRVRRTLETAMEVFGACGPRVSAIKVPQLCWLPLCRFWVQCVLKAWALQFPVWSSLLKQSTRMISILSAPLRRKAMNGAHLIQELSLSTFNVDPEELQVTQSGIDMFRLDFHGRFPVPGLHGDMSKLLLSSCFK